MNEYEGLNLTQLLDLMHEIVMPERVPWTLGGSGWWILAGWLVAVVLIVTIALARRYRRNRYRREAVVLLNDIEAAVGKDPVGAAGQIATVLKRAALVAYPRAGVASLYGKEWARFLCESASDDPVVVQASVALASAAYRRDVDGGVLVAPARRWIRVHRA